MSLSVNLLDPAIMGNESSMYELFDQLRENDPVALVEHPDFEPFWAITKYEDIKTISQNNAEFLNNPRTVLIQREFEEALLSQFGTRNGLETLIPYGQPETPQVAQRYTQLVQARPHQRTERGYQGYCQRICRQNGQYGWQV